VVRSVPHVEQLRLRSATLPVSVMSRRGAGTRGATADVGARRVPSCPTGRAAGTQRSARRPGAQRRRQTRRSLPASPRPPGPWRPQRPPPPAALHTAHAAIARKQRQACARTHGRAAQHGSRAGFRLRVMTCPEPSPVRGARPGLPRQPASARHARRSRSTAGSSNPPRPPPRASHRPAERPRPAPS